MSELGVRGSHVKNAVAWLAERTSRLKPNGRLRGDPRMQRLHELEALSLGIAGKLALWAGAAHRAGARRVTQIDLDELEARAREPARARRARAHRGGARGARPEPRVAATAARRSVQRRATRP